MANAARAGDGRVAAWVRTAPTLLLVAITLLAFDVAGRVALMLGRRPFEWTMAGLQRTLLAVFTLAGVRYLVEGTENIEPGTGYVLVSNHQSMLDIPLFGGVLVENFPKYVAKRELANWLPSISLNLKRGGNALIDRGRREQAEREIERVARECETRGTALVIFPEGTRSRDGSLGRFRVAGLDALLTAAPTMPVVPVAIEGSWRVMRSNMRPIWGAPVKIRFGTALPRSAGATAADIAEQCREWIRRTLDEWRATV